MLNRVFGNRYRLIEKVGIGGMAEVYKATDEVLGRTVAVKVMLPQYAADPSFAARFRQEAQAAANLQSPYIVNIYDWGQDDGTYFIAMEFVRGTDLKTAIEQRGAIGQRKVAEIGSQVCAALSVAHGYDIIHRDIKPHNIMVQPDGNAKVMDFGIARAGNSSMTQTGSVLGTAYYVSPEQAQGKPLTPVTDIYSLGIVLYETVTGRVPFDAPDAVAVALKQVNEQPVPPRQINPDIDPAFEDIILRAMQKNPADRYASADQMRIALNNYLTGRPIHMGVADPAARTRVIGAAAAAGQGLGPGSSIPVDGTAIMPTLEPTRGSMSYNATPQKSPEKKTPNRRTAIIVAIIAALLVIATGIIVAVNMLGQQETLVTVPRVIGASEEEALAEIEKVGLEKGTIDRQSSETVAEGQVISQNPQPDVKVDSGTKINLVVSSGKEPVKLVKVPDLKGKTPTEAEALLEELNLAYRTGEQRYDDTVEEGKICAQDPEAGKEVAEETKVTLIISKGKETFEVPNVKGKSKADAEALLLEHFQVAYANDQYNSTVPEGNVIDQDKTGKYPQGETITLTISKGPLKIPSVVNMTKDDAEATLNGLGYEVAYGPDQFSSTISEGNVISQDKTGGYPVGETVTLVVSKGPQP